MDIFTREDLRELTAVKGLCISLFMPTQRKGPETRQNPIRFKNLLGQAQEKLEQVHGESVAEILEPAQRLLENTRYWHFQSDGFVWFLSEGLSRIFRLPIELEELVMVGNRFHLKPLLTFITENMRWHALALSQSQPDLYQCTRQQIQRIEVEGMPKSLADAMRYEEPVKHFVLQPSSGPRGAGGSRLLHGHGGATEDDKNRILQYFRQLDRGVHGLLKEETSPLVLVGLDHLLALYREVNTYPHLLDQGLVVNPKELSEKELHRRVWTLVEPKLKEVRAEAISRYRGLAGTGKTSAVPAELVSAAYYGRIEILFVAQNQRMWGTFDPEKNRMELHRQEQPGDEDLLNVAALHTLAKGGTVYVLDSHDMPDEAPLTAVFRY